jgi:hypothetical protein
MLIDYLQSRDGLVHAINNKIDGAAMEVGILCLISCKQPTIRIANDHHSFLIEVPTQFRSTFERVKVFNALLNILDHEQIQFSARN